MAVSAINASSAIGLVSFSDLLVQSANSAAATADSTTLVSESKQVNQDGTISIFDKYADGSEHVSIEPNRDVPRQVSFLDALNLGQLSVLLNAQAFSSST